MRNSDEAPHSVSGLTSRGGDGEKLSHGGTKIMETRKKQRRLGDQKIDQGDQGTQRRVA
jgi:hypothetical protein